MKLPFFLEGKIYYEPPYVLAANPHYSDYLHVLFFYDNELFEMIEGAGQIINGKAIGKYYITIVNDKLATVELNDLVEVNVYQSDQRVRDMAPMKLTVVKEEGIFAFRIDSGLEKDKAKQPCLMYETRYVFDTDPLAFARNNSFQSGYFLDDKKDFTHSTRYYYAQDDRREFTAKRLFELGVRESEIK
ncbi:MAG: hypothetical protein HYR94_04350 [Chloroflexi bacterium]|nr:hypothetical protein [Chloroflexota bacterium]